MILADLDGVALAGRDAVVSRLKLIGDEWTENVYDDPRGVTSPNELLGMIASKGIEFAAMVLVGDMDTSIAGPNVIRTVDIVVYFAQTYGEGAGYDAFVNRVEKAENRMLSAELAVTIGSNSFSLTVTGSESTVPFSVGLDETGREEIGFLKATTFGTEVTVCV